MFNLILTPFRPPEGPRYLPGFKPPRCLDMKVFVLDKWRRPANRLDEQRFASVFIREDMRRFEHEVFTDSTEVFFSTLKRITNWEVFQCPKCELWSWSSQGWNHTIHLGFFMIYFRGATFWLTSLNWTLQAEKFQAVLSLLELKRTLLLLATGSGKSLCYQLPAYLCLGCHAGFSKWLDDTWDPGWTKRFESIYVWRFFVSHRLSSSRVLQRLWLVSLRYPQTKNSYIDSFTYVFWEPGSWTPVVPCWRCSWANSDKKTRWTWSLFSTLRLREEGLTLVVSPLVSLMQDQLARLPKCLFLGLSRIGSWETFFLGCAVGSGTCAAVHTCIRVGYLWLKSLTFKKMSSEASIV